MLGLCRLAAALLALAIPASAAPPEQPPSWAYDLWHDTMSPFCPGRSLADCPSPQAEALRVWIVEQAASGRSRTELEGDLENRFGDVVLAAPKPKGFGLAAYVIPVAAFVAGGLLVAVFLRRQTQTPEGSQGAAPAREPLDPELARVVDEELGRRGA
jgi:cytochrome c-type biogenesis protein CcmH/NrfF